MELAKRIVDLCFSHYSTNLPKKGQPCQDEWTTMAAVVYSRDDGDQKPTVVSMATGTKCRGESELTPSALSDSHAEVLARRGLLRYLYHHLALVYQGHTSDILERDGDALCRVKPDIEWHLFVTHTPCGDCSIIPRDERGNNVTKRCVGAKRNTKDSGLEALEPSKRHCTDENRALRQFDVGLKDVHRTGAKCVPGGKQDPHLPGDEYHVVGVLRTKPGRGERTPCMSCSDKIAKWNVCGLQGALLSIFLSHPIYLKSIIFGCCPFDLAVARRALIQRSANIQPLSPPFLHNRPCIFQVQRVFSHGKSAQRTRPSPVSCIWVNLPAGSFEVAVDGYRQGVTKKNRNKASACLKVARRNLFKEFHHVLSFVSSDNLRSLPSVGPHATYRDYKMAAASYQETWALVKKECFPNWTSKPAWLQEFKNDI